MFAQRLDRLDHLRFLAALLVMVWHFTSEYFPEPAKIAVPLFSIFAEGHTGVSLFCVISGYIFTWIYLDRGPGYREFIFKRILRIVPLFFFWIVIAFYSSDWDRLSLIGLLLTGLWRTGSLPPYLEQGWSVLIEFQFYLLFPFLVQFLQKYGAKYLLLLWALLLVVRAAVFFDRGDVFYLSYISIVGRMDQFLCGMLVGYVFRSQILNEVGRRRAVVGLGAASILALVLFYREFAAAGGISVKNGVFPFGPRIWIIIPTIEAAAYGAILAAYLCLPAAKSSVARWSGRIFAFLGTISYSIYLNHKFVFAVIFAMLRRADHRPSTWEQAVTMFLWLGLPSVLVLSIATYYLIERPFMDLRRHLTKPAPVS